MTPTPRIAAFAAAALLGLSGLAACSSSSSDTPSSSGSATSSSAAPSAPSSSAAPSTPSSSAAGGSDSAKTATITIKDFKYSGPSSVAPGTKVTVKNADTSAHTVTADKGGAFDVTVAPGKSGTFTAPDSAGSTPFHCTYHADMHGTLKVS